MRWAKAEMQSLAAEGRYSLVGGPFGSKLTSRDYASEGIPVIRGANMGNGRFLVMANFVYVTEKKVQEDLFGNLAYPGDLVFTQRGTLGQVAMIPETGASDRYVVSQSQMKMTPDSSKTDPRFLYYYFTTRQATERILNLTSSSGVPHINLTTLRKFEVPLPTLAEQRKIADTLSAYDDLIENNRRRIQLLEQAARLLYKEWFVHLRFPGHEHVTVTDGVPEGWERTTLSEVCETVGGGTPSTKTAEYWGGDITWVVPSDVTKNDSLALLGSERRITERGLRESSAKMVPKDTILMTSRASVGFFALMDYEVCTNQGFINVIPNDEEQRMYLLFNLMSRVEEIRSNAKGTTYPEISKGRFRQMAVTLPPQRLTAEFNRVAGDCVTQVRNLKRSSRGLSEARDLLLPRLMSGELAV